MSATSVARLEHRDVREALRLLGVRVPPGNRPTAVRTLREVLGAPGSVRGIVDRAPSDARAAFVRLTHEGPAPVEGLLGRGWVGYGPLPSPLDWLQRRALVLVGGDGLVHPSDEARENFLALTFDVTPPPEEPAPLRVEGVATVVIAVDAAALDRVMALSAAGLRAVAPTVAVSAKAPATVTAALRAAGVPLAADVVAAAADPSTPPLPGTAEEAVGPRAVRGLLERAVAERRQLRLQYFASSRGGAATERVVDPWSFRDDLLVGYCHLRRGERTFALDRVGRALLLPSVVEHAAPPGVGHQGRGDPR